MKSYLFFLLFNAYIFAIEPPPPPETKDYSVTLGVTTDYIARGTTQSLGEASAFITGEYRWKNFYVGGFLANMDFGDGTTVELDGWAGYRFALDKWNFDLSLLYYGYPNGPVTWDMQEGKMMISRSITEKLLATYTLAYSPDYFNVSGPSFWNELGLSYQITPKFSVSGSVARQAMTMAAHEYESYNTYNIGITYQVCKTVALDARYSDTNAHALGAYYDNAVSFTLRFSF